MSRNHYQPSRRAANLRGPIAATVSAVLGIMPIFAHGSRRRRKSRHRVSSGQADPTLQAIAAPDRMYLTLGQLIGIAAVSLLLSGVAFNLIRETLARRFADEQPERALRFDARSPMALRAAAEKEIVDPDGDLNAAKGWIGQALALSPLDERSIYLFGRLAERRGDPTQAADLIRLAGRASWRDLPVQLELLNQSILHKNYSEALKHADAYERVSRDYDYEGQLLPIFAAFVLDPDALRQLEQSLTTNPPWRTWLLRSFSERLKMLEPLQEIFSSLKGSKNPPSEEERAAYLQRLVRDGRYSEAYRQWKDGLPISARPDGRTPYNRDFKLPFDGSPFNWVVTAQHGADVSPELVDDGRHGVLLAQFSGARVDVSVKQLLLLPPGDYLFKGQVKAEDLQTNRGLWWRVSCAEDPTGRLGNTPLLSKSTQWADFGAEFTVPKTACAAQWLQMEIPARVASDKEIAGEVRFRYLRVQTGEQGGPALLDFQQSFSGMHGRTK